MKPGAFEGKDSMRSEITAYSIPTRSCLSTAGSTPGGPGAAHEAHAWGPVCTRWGAAVLAIRPGAWRSGGGADSSVALFDVPPVSHDDVDAFASRRRFDGALDLVVELVHGRRNSRRLRPAATRPERLAGREDEGEQQDQDEMSGLEHTPNMGNLASSSAPRLAREVKRPVNKVNVRFNELSEAVPTPARGAGCRAGAGPLDLVRKRRTYT